MKRSVANGTNQIANFFQAEKARGKRNRNKKTMKKRPYSLEPYNPEWVEQFGEIKNRLSDVWGVALSIEHMGSTAIPGVASKPIIDILIIVSEMESFENEKKKMTDLGYKWGEDYVEPNSLLFFKENADSRKTENIHVCVKGLHKAIQFITTRDYLRTHPERAKAYGDLKLGLKNKHPDDYPAYRAEKKVFQDETERLTKAWLAEKNR